MDVEGISNGERVESVLFVWSMLLMYFRSNERMKFEMEEVFVGASLTHLRAISFVWNHDCSVDTFSLEASMRSWSRSQLEATKTGYNKRR